MPPSSRLAVLLTSFLLVVALLPRPSEAGQQTERPTPILADGVWTFLGLAPRSREQTEDALTRFGLAKESDDVWTRQDASGELRVLSFPPDAFIVFFPAVLLQIPAPVLAELISDGELVGLDAADTLELRLSTKTLIAGDRVGSQSETIFFALGSGAHMRTGVSIQWSDP